jgi:hypothetical protein
MNPPAWQERSFEGRSVRVTALTGEEELRTAHGTRYPIFAEVEILSGLFKGAVYDKVPIYSPPLKAQLLELGSVAGRLCKGAALEGAPIQWVVKI